MARHWNFLPATLGMCVWGEQGLQVHSVLGTGNHACADGVQPSPWRLVGPCPVCSALWRSAGSWRGGWWPLCTEPPCHLGLCPTPPATVLPPCPFGLNTDAGDGFGPPSTPEGRQRHAAVHLPGKACRGAYRPCPCHEGSSSRAERKSCPGAPGRLPVCPRGSDPPLDPLSTPRPLRAEPSPTSSRCCGREGGVGFSIPGGGTG